MVIITGMNMIIAFYGPIIAQPQNVYSISPVQSAVV